MFRKFKSQIVLYEFLDSEKENLIPTYVWIIIWSHQKLLVNVCYGFGVVDRWASLTIHTEQWNFQGTLKALWNNEVSKKCCQCSWHVCSFVDSWELLNVIKKFRRIPLLIRQSMHHTGISEIQRALSSALDTTGFNKRKIIVFTGDELINLHLLDGWDDSWVYKRYNF